MEFSITYSESVWANPHGFPLNMESSINFLHDLRSPHDLAAATPPNSSLAVLLRARYSSGNHASWTDHTFSHLTLITHTLLCVYIFLPRLFTLMSSYHPGLSLTISTCWPIPLCRPTLTWLLPVHFQIQQSHKKRTGGRPDCELERVLVPHTNMLLVSPCSCLWEHYTLNMWGHHIFLGLRWKTISIRMPRGCSPWDKSWTALCCRMCGI